MILSPSSPYCSDFQQGFSKHLPSVPQLASKNNLACEITPDKVTENQHQTKIKLLHIYFCIDLL